MPVIEILNNSGASGYAKLLFDYSYTEGNSYITLNGIKLQYHENWWFPWYPGRTNSNNGKQTFIKINNYEIKGTIYGVATYYWGDSSSYLAAQSNGGGSTSDVQNVRINLVDGKLNFDITCYLFSLGTNASNGTYFNGITRSVAIVTTPAEPEESHSEDTSAEIKSHKFITAKGLNALKTKIKTMYSNRPLITSAQKGYASTALNNNYFQPHDKTEIEQIGDLINACLVINDIPNLKFVDLANSSNAYVNRGENIFGDGTSTNLMTWLSDAKKNATGTSTNHGCRSACTGICSGGCTGSADGSDGTTSGWPAYQHYGKKTGCSDCTGTCSGGCGACHHVCSGTCSADCTRTCGGTGRANSCGTSCGAGCDGECTSGCIYACKVSCSDGCSGICADTCRSSCYSGCEAGCTTNCGGGCKGTCGDSCNGCGTSCGGACGGTCEGCGGTCTNGCSGKINL